jgi:uncharacterized membrane-anchored protein YhcB (DUF1043 family)
MLPVLFALQGMIVVQAIQALALLLAVAYLAHRFSAEAAESRRRDREQVQAVAAELNALRATVKAARAESATYLEAVFSGVRGMARNLDAARDTSAQTLEELRRRSGPESTPDLAVDTSADPLRGDAVPSRRPRVLEERCMEIVRLRDVAATAPPRKQIQGEPG